MRPGEKRTSWFLLLERKIVYLVQITAGYSGEGDRREQLNYIKYSQLWL